MQNSGLGAKFNCRWCDYTTYGLESIRSHICVHLDYFPLQCNHCGHYLPSRLMFNFHCELKRHPFGCSARELLDPELESRADEMVIQVLKGMDVNGTTGERNKEMPPMSTPEIPFNDASSETGSTMGDEEDGVAPKPKYICSKCNRGYILNKVAKHIWGHIAVEHNGLTPFSCQDANCNYTTHLKPSAVHHHTTVHNRQSPMEDKRTECGVVYKPYSSTNFSGPLFENSLRDWFGLDHSDFLKVMKKRFGNCG